MSLSIAVVVVLLLIALGLVAYVRHVQRTSRESYRMVDQVRSERRATVATFQAKASKGVASKRLTPPQGREAS